MTEEGFEREHAATWDEFEALLVELEAGRGERAAELPRRYRQLCQQLTQARSRRFSAHLVDRLQGLALGGHRQLYAAPRVSGAGIARALARDFPRAVRAEASLVLLCGLLLLGPALALFTSIQLRPELVYRVLEREKVRSFEELYEAGGERVGRSDAAAGDVLMFGFYVRNNVGIALSTFGAGIMFALAPLVLIGNGILIGAVAGHLTHAGLGGSFWPFVIGHGAPELTAIALAGAAGMRLGLAWLVPGRRRRGESLRAAARGALPIIVGSAGLLVVAAAIEAFWSARAEVVPAVRYAVGALLWLAVLAYLAAAGGRRAA